MIAPIFVNSTIVLTLINSLGWIASPECNQTSLYGDETRVQCDAVGGITHLVKGRLTQSNFSYSLMDLGLGGGFEDQSSASPKALETGLQEVTLLNAPRLTGTIPQVTYSCTVCCENTTVFPMFFPGGEVFRIEGAPSLSGTLPNATFQSLLSYSASINPDCPLIPSPFMSRVDPALRG